MSRSVRGSRGVVRGGCCLGDATPNTTTRYLSTAIPFINGPPHLGHALELVQADALARAWRARGIDVRFQTGTDENSLSCVRAAREAGLAPAEFAARSAARFRDLRHTLCLSWDDFVRTSADPRHRAGAERLWRAVEAAGDLYRRRYAGHYCVGCEQFLAEAEQVGGRCPEHDAPLEWVEEENWFFRLSRYADAIAERLRDGRLQILPASRANEALRWIEAGLPDFSVSRSRERAQGWGLGVPGDPDQVQYVWFDALGNYVSALDWAGEGADYRRYWRDAGSRTHLIGKGITRFHALYWPALLLSAGLVLPDRLLIHGYVTVGGEKLSKSRGNAVDPVALVGEWGVDAVRYYLLRHVRSSEDGDFDAVRLATAYRSELAGQLGNLLNRTLGLLGRYRDGRVPDPGPQPECAEAAARLDTEIADCLEHFALHDALAALWRPIADLNREVEQRRPWDLARLERDAPTEHARTRARSELDRALGALVEGLRVVAVQLEPFLPDAAQAILHALGTEGTRGRARAWGSSLVGARTRPRELLFPPRAP